MTQNLKYRKLKKLNNYDASIVLFCIPLRDNLKAYKSNDNYVIYGKYKMFLTKAIKNLEVIINEITDQGLRISDSQIVRSKKFSIENFINTIDNNTSGIQIREDQVGEDESRLLAVIDVFTSALETYLREYRDKIPKKSLKLATTGTKWSRHFLEGIGEILEGTNETTN